MNPNAAPEFPVTFASAPAATLWLLPLSVALAPSTVDELVPVADAPRPTAVFRDWSAVAPWPTARALTALPVVLPAPSAVELAAVADAACPTAVLPESALVLAPIAVALWAVADADLPSTVAESKPPSVADAPTSCGRRAGNRGRLLPTAVRFVLSPGVALSTRPFDSSILIVIFLQVRTALLLSFSGNIRGSFLFSRALARTRLLFLSG